MLLVNSLKYGLPESRHEDTKRQAKLSTASRHEFVRVVLHLWPCLQSKTCKIVADGFCRHERELATQVRTAAYVGHLKCHLRKKMLV